MKKIVMVMQVLFSSLLCMSHGPLQIIPAKVSNPEIPALKMGETVIKHLGYSLSYNEPYEQANWVAYMLTSQETKGIYKRTNKFIEDPLVASGTADNKDYLHSDLDRGHLAPAGDMKWSEQSMAESFYYSNMSPQVPTFNRGIWEHGEELVRAWAVENKAIYIVVGPVLTKGLPTIGPNRVAVPRFYFKVILDYTLPQVKAIGLIIPNGDNYKPLKNYFVSVDSVEKFTGIDFFPALPDDQEEKIESHLDLNAWNWGHLPAVKAGFDKKPASASASSANSDAAAVQCLGMTKKGARCKKRTKNTNHRCEMHQ